MVGAAGVGVCVSELIFLGKNKNYLKKVVGQVRVIDLISCLSGVVLIIGYWLSNGQWMMNDILGVCSIVGLLKLLKVRSLKMGVILLSSLLILEIAVGLFVHYVFNTSYNNYVINKFQSPIVLVLPSITHELYRRCAWLPISSILFPGLLLSYLRRFDLSRATFIYLLIGLFSFYFGSVLWMFLDVETIHSLPFAIVSEPITVLILSLVSYKRNEFRTLWKGNFHDEELESYVWREKEKETEIVEGGYAADLTDNIKLEARNLSMSSESYYVSLADDKILNTQ